MAGAAVDVFTAGMSLGAAALTGAAIGGLWQGIDRVGQRVLGRLRGWRELTVHDAVLRLLAVRAQTLVQALERRGHAAREPVSVSAQDEAGQTQADSILRDGALPEALIQARAQPSWCTMSEAYADGPDREAAVRELAQVLVT
jgi:hypothetical protein